MHNALVSDDLDKDILLHVNKEVIPSSDQELLQAEVYSLSHKWLLN